MSIIRPAGFSDSDTDSDDFDYGYSNLPKQRIKIEVSPWKKVETQVSDAVIADDLEEVKRLIRDELSTNVNVKLDSGWTILMLACSQGKYKIVKYLLENEANPNLHADSVMPIMVACSNSSADEDALNNVVMLLIEHGAFLNIGDAHGQTPLMRAIVSGRVSIVQKLLKEDVNIEMRDSQGWTAIFWAVHNNKADIVEILIENGARLNEVDNHQRTVLDIAGSHQYDDIIQLLHDHIDVEVEKEILPNHLALNKVLSWHYFYPGIKDDKTPTYSSEIAHLLYGMNCEHLTRLFVNSEMDLRTFLLMQDEDMEKLGINLPYEKQRLNNGIKKFHLLKWKLSSVSGLYAGKTENYSVVDCLTTLGSHLQQVYILEASLQYTCRNYNFCAQQLKFEPPDSPNIIKLKNLIQNIKIYIRDIKKELMIMNNMFTKMSKKNPPPADLIKRTSSCQSTIGTTAKIVAMVSMGLLVYNSRYIINMFKK